MKITVIFRYNFSTIDTTDPSVMKREKKKLKNVILSFLLNVGGGVLIANCFCHWLPEVREGIEGRNIDTFLPLAEVIMCAGFFFISALEEILHHFLHPHQSPSSKMKLEVKETNFSSGDMDDHSGVVSSDGEDKEDSETERTAAEIKAAIRTVFVVFALSFHSVVEGLALGLEGESGGVWLNTGATALHKFVIAFSVGVELITNRLNMMTYTISIVVFSIAPALGALIGILLTELSFDCSAQERIDLPLQILQGIATGTVLYVVFFEIIPKGKQVGGTGKQHILAMTLGFAIFLPSLYFREYNPSFFSVQFTCVDDDHHEDEGHGACANKTLTGAGIEVLELNKF